VYAAVGVGVPCRMLIPTSGWISRPYSTFCPSGLGLP
jgi:hypothetical protein